MDLRDLFDVRGKHVVITGGSRGIGLMIARALVTNGATVFLTARKVNELNEAVAALNKIAAGSAIAIPGDVGTDQECRRIVQQVALHTSKVHVLFNNAGITWGDDFDTYPEAAWGRLMAVNVASIFHLTRAFVPMLEAAAKPDDPARVINVSSIAGLAVSRFDNAYAYSSTKAAVVNLTRQLAAKLTERGIAVNAICPGVFPSKMSRYYTDDETRREVAMSMIPMGRFGNETDMGGLGVFLSSKASGYLSGAIIPYDGGQTAGARL